MSFRRQTLRFADRLGLYGLLQRRRRGALVLGYHGVEEVIRDERIQPLHLPASVFEEHLDHLTKHFELISLRDLAERLEEGRGLDGRQVVLSFDDGYRNNLELVAPKLHARGLPFVVFVCPDRISSGRRFATYLLRAAVHLTETQRFQSSVLGREFSLENEQQRDHAVSEISRELKRLDQLRVDRLEEELRTLHPEDRWDEIDAGFDSDALLDWDELRELRSGGAEIASHTSQHCILHERQEPERVRTELRGSRERIADELGVCSFLAYPNGRHEDISEYAITEARAAGYRLALSLEFGEVDFDSDRWCLPRVDAGVDLDTLKFFVHVGRSPRSGAGSRKVAAR